MTDVPSTFVPFAKNFGGQLLFPADPAWDAARRIHNGLVDKRPLVIAQCLGSADIANAVRLAQEHGLEMAVRGGGHNVSGRATVEGGLVIDLSPMRYVHVDPVARSALVAGGTLWGHVNRETQAYGLATTGGVVSTTGVAGLTLGGGLGWLMPRHGMALDNLLGVEMVLADGQVVRAAADENPDLFWAVRGGGGNFGVASSFEFRLHQVGPTVTGGLVAWPIDQARDVLHLYRELAEKAGDDMMLVAGLITAPDRKTKLVAIVAAFVGGVSDGEAAVKPIKAFSRPVMDAMGPVPYTQLNAMLDESYPRGARNYWKSRFCKELTDTAIEAMIDRFMGCPSPMSQILIERFHGEAARIAPTATAYALRATGFNVLIVSQWAAPSEDEPGTAWARETYSALQPYAASHRYLNYFDQDDAGASDLAAAYGPNVRRLQAIKAKYDPHNVFHLNVNIPPKA